jgi:hypothetical protein
MSLSDDEILIDDLLIYMNRALEEMGLTPGLHHFSFDEGEKDSAAVTSQFGWGSNDVIRVVKICLTRHYLKHSCLNAGLCSRLTLTSDGQRRAIAAKLERKRARESTSRMSTSVNHDHSFGNNVQINGQASVIIGSNNQQNVHPLGGANSEKSHKAGNDLLKHPLFVGVALAVLTAVLTLFVSLYTGGK